MLRSRFLPLVFALFAAPSLPALCDGGCLSGTPIARTAPACHGPHATVVAAAAGGACPRAGSTAGVLTLPVPREGVPSTRELRAVIATPAPLVPHAPASFLTQRPVHVRPAHPRPLEVALRI